MPCVSACACAGEEGVDAGGLTKEFFALLIERLFDPLYGMFVLNDETRRAMAPPPW